MKKLLLATTLSAIWFSSLANAAVTSNEIAPALWAVQSAQMQCEVEIPEKVYRAALLSWSFVSEQNKMQAIIVVEKSIKDMGVKQFCDRMRGIDYSNFPKGE